MSQSLIDRRPVETRPRASVVLNRPRVRFVPFGAEGRKVESTGEEPEIRLRRQRELQARSEIESAYSTRTSLLGFAERAVSQFARAEDRATALLWARAALAAYERLAASDSSLEESAMALRLRLVAEYGPDCDPVASPRIVVDWFLDRLPWSVDEILTRAARRRQLSIAEIRKLRGVKSRLGLLAELATSCPEALVEGIRRLLANRERLP